MTDGGGDTTGDNEETVELPNYEGQNWTNSPTGGSNSPDGDGSDNNEDDNLESPPLIWEDLSGDDDIDDKINDYALDPCSKAILDTIIEGKSIEEIVNQFAGEDSDFNWTLETSNTTNAANTTWIDGRLNSYLTQIDSDYRNSATQLAIARTIVHEAIHAYTLSNLDSNTESFVKVFPELWNDLVAKKYGDPNTSTGWNKYHHEEMARNYINAISNAIVVWDRNRQDPSYYSDLAWGGLLDTQIFQLTDDLNDDDTV